jgi:hypothetical protein
MPSLDWDSPDPGIASDRDASTKPDSSFHDDHVGGRIKTDEAAKARLVNDRFVADVPRRIIDAQAKVSEAGAFRPTQEDEEARRAERRTRNMPRGPNGRAKRIPRRDPRTIAGGTEPGVDRVEDKIEALWGDLEAITRALDDEAAQEQAQDEQTPQSDEEAAQDIAAVQELELERARLLARQLRLETAAKQQLQLLLAGGIGLSLMADPRQTFRRLFDRIEHWPPQVKPGKRPETDEEFDIFLAYVFAPPGTDDEEDFW